MKKFFAILVLPVLAMIFSVSCDDNKVVGAPTVTPDKIELEAGSENVSKLITVEADAAWGVRSEVDWIDVRDVTQTTFTIDIEPYTEGTEPSREGTVVVNIDEKQARVTVTQALYVADFVLNVDPDRLDVEAGVEYNISVEADHAWEVEAESEWIVVDNITETGFTFTVESYVGEQEPREGIIKVFSDKVERKVTVKQKSVVQPSVATLGDYLGIYNVSADLESNIDPSLGGGEETSYSGRSEMVLRPEAGENVVSMQVMNNIGGGNDGTGGGNTLFFTYDPETGTLRNNNTDYPGNDVFVCTFGYYIIQANEFKKFTAAEENSLSIGLDAERRLSIPNTCNADGVDYRLYVLDFNPLHGLTWSMYRMYNIRMVKE